MNLKTETIEEIARLINKDSQFSSIDEVLKTLKNAKDEKINQEIEKYEDEYYQILQDLSEFEIFGNYKLNGNAKELFLKLENILSNHHDLILNLIRLKEIVNDVRKQKNLIDYNYEYYSGFFEGGKNETWF